MRHATDRRWRGQRTGASETPADHLMEGAYGPHGRHQLGDGSTRSPHESPTPPYPGEPQPHAPLLSFSCHSAQQACSIVPGAGLSIGLTVRGKELRHGQEERQFRTTPAGPEGPCGMAFALGASLEWEAPHLVLATTRGTPARSLAGQRRCPAASVTTWAGESTARVTFPER